MVVWLHGGGNFGGTASDPNSAGDGPGARGLVVVTLNYRLGLFGFLAHPALTRESPHHASGNYGLMDQIAALRWVRDNIAKFGGDPAHVTIGGQSAGAVDVNVLMTSPLAKGLFHHAIAESGTVTRVPDDATVRMTGLATTMAPRSGDTYSDALTLAGSREAGAQLPANPRSLTTAGSSEGDVGAAHEHRSGERDRSWTAGFFPKRRPRCSSRAGNIACRCSSATIRASGRRRSQSTR